MKCFDTLNEMENLRDEIHRLRENAQAMEKMAEMLKRLLPVAENWAYNCEINGEGPNNPAAVVVREARIVLANAEKWE